MEEKTEEPVSSPKEMHSDFTQNDLYENLPEEAKKEMKHRGTFFDAAVNNLKKQRGNPRIDIGHLTLLQQAVVRNLYDVLLIPVTHAAHSPSPNELKRRAFHVTVHVLLGEHPKWDLLETELLGILGVAYNMAMLGQFFFPNS